MVSLIVCGITGGAVFLSVLLKPCFYIGKIKIGTYWPISLAGALIILLSGSLPAEYLFRELTSPSSVNPIKILVLFFSMTALSVFLDEAGFFRYLASAVLRRTGGRQITMFATLYAVVSVLTVFTSNDIVVLTFTPFICLFAKKAKIDPVPYLFAEFVAANTWSMLLMIGNPTNVYLSSAAGIGFLAYLAKMALPACFAGIVSFALLLVLFRKRLKKPLERTEENAETLEDKPSVWIGAAHLAVCTLLLAVGSYLSLEMYLVAAVSAASMFLCVFFVRLARKKPLALIGASLKRLPYELIPFLLSMFVLVLSLNYSGMTEKFAAALSKGPPVFTVGTVSFFVSNVINNIPMSVLFGSVLGCGTGSGAPPADVFAAVVGSNIGAFFTPVGALAGIMWMSLLRRFRVDFSFGKFLLYGAAVSFPTLFAALGGLCIVF